MDAEAKNIIAFAFKRSGKHELTESELYLTLSLNLNWFPPKIAKEFIHRALKRNLLIKKGDVLTPAFDWKKVTAPVGFSPSKQPFKVKEEEQIEKRDILELIINHIVKKTGQDKKNIITEIKNITKGKQILPSVAALMICKESTVDIEKFIGKIESSIFREDED